MARTLFVGGGDRNLLMLPDIIPGIIAIKLPRNVEAHWPTISSDGVVVANDSWACVIVQILVGFGAARSDEIELDKVNAPVDKCKC